MAHFINFITGDNVTLACPSCGPVPTGAVITECTTHAQQALRGEDAVTAMTNAGVAPTVADAVEVDLTTAEADIARLCEEGKFEEAELLVEAYSAQILAAHGLS